MTVSAESFRPPLPSVTCALTRSTDAPTAAAASRAAQPPAREGAEPGAEPPDLGEGARVTMCARTEADLGLLTAKRQKEQPLKSFSRFIRRVAPLGSAWVQQLG